MSYKNDIQAFAVPLGWSLAKVETCVADGVGAPYQRLQLYIVTPSCTDNGAHSPAESINIYGYVNIVALRDLLNKAIAIANKGATAEPIVEAVNQVAIETV